MEDLISYTAVSFCRCAQLH